MIQTSKNARSLIEDLEPRRLFTATAYYVDNAAPAGGNGSSAAPWNSIAQVNAAAAGAGFGADDVIQFQGGESFSGTLTLGSKVGGVTGHPVLVTSYGTGRANLLAGNAGGISVSNTSGIEIANLNIVGLLPATPGTAGSAQAPASFSGIQFDNNLTTQSGSTTLSVKLDQGVTIEDVDVSGFGKFGITIGGSVQKSGFSHVVISGARVHDNTVGGIETHGVFSQTAIQTSDAGYANTDVTVDDCEVFNNTGYANSPNHSGDGILLSDVRGAVIEHSEAYQNGAKNTHNGGPVGIWAWDADSVTIEHNVSHDNHTASSQDGDGFDFDGGTTHSVMQYNYSYNNDGCGYGIFQFRGARSYHDNVFRYNISENDGRKNGYAGFQMWSGDSAALQNLQIYNNTVYTGSTGAVSKSNPAPSGAVYLQSAKCVNVNFRNNIFTTGGGVNLLTATSGSSGVQFQRNDWYNLAGKSQFKQGSKTYSTLASWASAAGQEKDPSSRLFIGLAVNPLFAATPGSAGASGYALQYTDSRGAVNPLIDTAWDLRSRFGFDTGSTDYDSLSIPSGSGYDFGALEYQYA